MKHSAKTLANLQKFLTLLDPTLSLNEMLTNVACQLVEMFGVDHSGMLLFGPADQEGQVIAEYPAQGAVGLRVPFAQYPLVERLKQEQKPVAIVDAQRDPQMGSARATMQQLGIQSIVIIPLVVRGKIVGSLSLDAITVPRAFTPAELNLCHIIANQIAVAVDYSFALAAVEAGRRRAQTLREINRVLSQSLDLEEVLQLILEQLEVVLPVQASSIYLLDDGHLRLKAYRGRVKPLEARQGIEPERLWGVAEIINSQQPLLVSDTLNEARWVFHQDKTVRCWLGVPLLIQREIVGILNMNGASPGQFNDSHIPLATDFANQAAIAIHNANLYGQATRRANLLSSIQEIGVSIVSSLDLRDVLATVSTSIIDLFQANRINIFLYDGATDRFVLASALERGGVLDMVQVDPVPPRRNGLTAQVARSGQLLAIDDMAGHPLYRGLSQFAEFRAIVGVPLKKRSEVVGVVNVVYREPRHFTAEELDALELLATQAAVALDNARLYELEVKAVEQELAIARQIQQGFLPAEIPVIPGWHLAAACLPARETGGDFYEFVRRHDDSWGVAVGDVSGKSIQAAMLMGAAQSTVAAKGSDHRSPARVVTDTNRLLHEDIPPGSFVAMSYALVTPRQGDICLSNAGQLAPYLVPAAGQPVHLVEPPGSHWPMGVLPEVTYEEMQLSLLPGDMLVFFTDGLVERMNAQAQLFGFGGVEAVLAQARGQPAPEVMSALLTAANHFAAGRRAHDDVTILVLQRV